MQITMRSTLSALLTSGLIFCAASAALAGDPIDERVKAFKGAKQSFAQVKDGLSSGDNAAIAEAAKSLAALGGRIPDMFPVGSNKGKTDAKDEIWSNFSDFSAKAKTMQERSQALALLASSGGTKDQLAEAAGQVMDSCKSCHRRYKED